jgi:glucose-6-phosphate isomerase
MARPPAQIQPDDLLAAMASQRIASNIWRRRPTIFLPAMAPPVQLEAIEQRLGWLDAPADAARQVADLDVFVTGVRRDGFGDVVLLGMGGSSLAAEVLRDVPAPKRAGARLTVLDTTDERTIRDVSSRLAPERTLFIVASKSGSTIEVSSLERHFWSLLSSRRGGVGTQFIAITDPETALAELAAQRGYRRTFLNRDDIGGRYSALSLFGLVPAGLLGWDLRTLVGSGQRMATACGPDNTANPGLALGAFLAAELQSGRDKLTLIASPALLSFASWIEQLVAESSGKDGRGVLPVVGEPVGEPAEYGADRAFVALLLPGDDATEAQARRLEDAGRRVLRLAMPPEELGGEFFRWEFATAVLGTSLRANPFDEPNVRDAKTRTGEQLTYRAKTGNFRIVPPLERRTGCLMRVSRSTRPRPPGPRYLALLDYLPADAARADVIARVRVQHRQATGCATTHGVGPRYLHSTGQYHKGGPNTGLFVLLTGVDDSRIQVPGDTYSFSTLKYAQALGDFEALVAAGRDVVHCHFETAPADLEGTLEQAIKSLGTG